MVIERVGDGVIRIDRIDVSALAIRFAVPSVVMTASAPPATTARTVATGSMSPPTGPMYPAWSNATMSARPSEANTRRIRCAFECIWITLPVNAFVPQIGRLFFGTV